MLVGLFAHSSHRLFQDVLRLTERIGRTVVFDRDGDWCDERDAADSGVDLVLNFVTRCVFRGYVLSRPNVNFHPAPPCYPGIGGVSRALYDGAPLFGATAHRMVRNIDAGEIYYTDSFPILQFDTPETLFARAEQSCAMLFARTADHVSRHGELPAASADRWSGRYMSIREFHDVWLRLDPTDPADMDRKLRAATHSKHPGPFIIINGRRFVLAK